MTNEERNALVKAIQQNLDTRDKRFMFLKCMFKGSETFLPLEGPPLQVASDIYKYFELCSMLGSLVACLNMVFDLYFNGLVLVFHLRLAREDPRAFLIQKIFCVFLCRMQNIF